MKVTRITVTFGGKVNLGNYQNVELSMSHEVELAEGENPVDASIRAMKQVKALLVTEVQALNSPQTASWIGAVSADDEDHLPY